MHVRNINREVVMKYLSVVLTLLLAGCGSESDSAKNATLEDLVGAWDTSDKMEQEIDEAYFIVEENGHTTDFDYDGDSYNKGSNCYYRYDSATLTDLGEGDFLAKDSSFESTLNITISGNTITIINSHEDKLYTSEAIKIDRIESDFTPLCN